mgnify:CR=1 FL=1
MPTIWQWPNVAIEGPEQAQLAKVRVERRVRRQTVTTGEEAMALEKTCTATQLIERLRQLVEQHGDIPVYADDADTGWRLPIGLVHKPADADEEWPERLEIKTDYHGRPKGDF